MQLAQQAVHTATKWSLNFFIYLSSAWICVRQSFGWTENQGAYQTFILLASLTQVCTVMLYLSVAFTSCNDGPCAYLTCHPCRYAFPGAEKGLPLSIRSPVSSGA